MARRTRQGPSTTEFILNSRGGSFAADVDRIIANTEKRLDLVMKQSLLNTINDMQKVGPSVASTKADIKNAGSKIGPVAAAGEGGRMRVDTGFLRASGQLSLNGMPTGPNQKPKDALPGSFKWDGATLQGEIGGAEIGATFWWGWTASYARYREAYDGFMYAALQKWQQTVDAVIAEAKRRFP